MSSYYRNGKLLVCQGGLDMRETGADIRMILVMSNNTTHNSGVGGEVFVGDLAVLDECDAASGYVRKPIAAQSLVFSADNVIFSGTTPITYTALGASTRNNVAWVAYKHVTNDADSPLIAFLNSGGFPFLGTGIDVPFSFANGLWVLQ